MKKIMAFATLLLLIIAAIYSFTYFIVIPNIARVMIPYKWKTISLHQKRMDIVTYLGKTPGFTSQANTDDWLERRNNYSYQLHVSYNAADSAASGYVIKYRFSNRLFNRTGVLLSGN